MRQLARHRLRIAALAAVLVACLAGTAVAAFEAASVTGDLDGDGDTETARTVDADGDGNRTQVWISDECADGTTTDRRVTGTEESNAFLRLYSADTRAGREVFTDLRSGASGRVGQARLVAWRQRAGANCPVPRALFKYSSANPSRPPPGATENSSFGVRVKNAASRYPGREVILDEFYVTREVPAGCCPSFQKRRYFRYRRGKDRYVQYRSRVTRLMPEE